MMQYLSSTQFYATNWNYLPHTAVCPLVQTTITPLTEFDPLHCVAEGLQRRKAEYEWGRGCYETFYEQAGKKRWELIWQWLRSHLGLWFCPTHICMCFRFQWCINKQQPLSKSRVPCCIWGLSVVITGHLIIITTSIKNESVLARDICMATIAGWVAHIANFKPIRRYVAFHLISIIAQRPRPLCERAYCRLYLPLCVLAIMCARWSVR